MKAEAVINRRITLSANAFAEVVIWKLAAPVPGSDHLFKFRLAYVVDDACVLRFDNEAGKGGHIHENGEERDYAFTSPEQLLNDFFAAIDNLEG